MKNHKQTHIMVMTRKICGVFATSLILALQPILFHLIVAEGHYTLCSKKRFFRKKSRAQLFDYGIATAMLKVTHNYYVVWCA